MEFNRKTYQYFVSDNFGKVKDYLSEGVFDRYEEWIKCNNKKLQINIHRQAREKDNEIEVGDILLSKGICVGIGEEFKDSNPPCFEKIYIYSDSKRKGIPYYFSPLKKEETKLDNEVYSYDNAEKEKHYIIKVGKDKEKAKYYNRDFYINLDPSDSDIWDSFFTLYLIIGYASTKERKGWSAAAIDFEDCVKIVNGQIANPMRFLLGLGDQHMKYLFEAFGINNECEAYVKQNLDVNEKPKSVTFDDRINYLEKQCEEKFDDQPKMLQNCKEIINLMHLRRMVRNTEGHQEVAWSNPVGMMRKYLRDYVVIVYLIKHILKIQLCIPSDFMKSIKEILYYPVAVEEGLIIEDATSIDNHHYYVQAYEKYIVKNEKSNDIIELEITEINNVSGLEIRLLNGTICIDNTAVLELLNRIEYNPILKSIQEQIADIRGCIITQDEVKKIIEKEMSQYISYIDSKIAEDLQNNEENIRLAKNELSRVEKDYNDNLKEISSRIADVIDQVEEHGLHLKLLDDDINKHGKDIGQINGILAKLEETIGVVIGAIEQIKKKKRKVLICVAIVAAVLLSGVIGWFVFRNDLIKNHYTKKANQALILARDCENNDDYENAAIHNKTAFDNTLKAFQIDTTDNNIRRKLIYMYQWGKGTQENHEEALKLAIPIKDDSPENFGRYIYLRYITNPEDSLSILSDIEHKRYNNTDSSIQAFLQDSLVRLTKAVIGLSFADNEQDEDEYLSEIKGFDEAGMYEAKWEMVKFMLHQKKLFESGKSVHFMPAETLNKLHTIACGLNYGEAWRELGNICDIFEVNDLAALSYKKAILAGKEDLYINYALSNYELWREYNDTIYEKTYKTYMLKAAENGDDYAKLVIDLNNDNIKHRDIALLENKAAPRFSASIAGELIRKNPSSSTMNTILRILQKNGRNDITLSYLLAHKAFYENNILEYISRMQQAWIDSCFSAYLCLGNYCINIGEYDNARYYYNKVKEDASNDTIRSEAYSSLMNIALIEGDTISFKYNTPNSSLLMKLQSGHYKDNPEYIITECQSLLFSNRQDLNTKGSMAFLIGNTYQYLGNYSLAIDWFELAAHTLRQTWVYGPLLTLTRYIERMDAFEMFKEIEGYDLSSKKDWSQDEEEMLIYIYRNLIPKHFLVDASSGKIHDVVPYALSKWGEEILKSNELPDKYKMSLLWLADDTDSFYGSTVKQDLSEYGLDISMSLEDFDFEDVIYNLSSIMVPRILPDDHPRMVEF